MYTVFTILIFKKIIMKYRAKKSYLKGFINFELDLKTWKDYKENK